MSDLDLFEEEDDQVDEDDITLAEYNMNPKYKKGFMAMNKDKKILYRNKPTNDFVEFYLAHCTNKEFNRLLEHADKFSKAQREMLDKVDKIKQEQQDIMEETSTPTNNKSTISDYINKNQELIKQNKELIAKVNHLKLREQQLKWLFELMKEKCTWKEGIEFDESEMDMIEQIREATK